MFKNKSILVSIAAIIISAAALVLSFGKISNESLGAFPGPVHATLEYFNKGLIKGGNVVAISGAASTTASQICEGSILNLTPTASSSVITLPTASSLISTCLPNTGDTYWIYARNTKGAGFQNQFVANTGGTIYTPTSTTNGSVLDAGQRAKLTFVNIGSSAVSTIIEAYK